MKFERDEGGQASVVGTIMAIMIMLAVLSLVTTQYVPVTMYEYEAQHMNDIVTEFSNMRQNIDNLMLTNQRGLSMHSSITLGTGYVPVFSSPTSSRITFQPNNNQYQIQFSTGDFGLVTEASSGALSIYTANRYYVAQTVYYENSAILLNQGRVQIVRASPHFDVVQLPDGNISLTMTLQDVLGQADSETGVHTVGIQTVLRSSESWEYTNLTSDIYYNITTKNTEAWFAIFNSTLSDNMDETVSSYSEADLDGNGVADRKIETNYYTLTEYSPLTDFDDESTGIVRLQISNVSTFLLNTATVNLVLGTEDFT